MRNKVGGPGSYSVVCDRCGFKFKNHQLVKEWTGLMVCHGPGTNDCWEPRHVQDFVRAINDQPKLPFVRPDTDGADVGPAFSCTGIEEIGYTVPSFQNLLNSHAPLSGDPDNELTIYKVNVVGDTVHIPAGLDLIVKCTLTISGVYVESIRITEDGELRLTEDNEIRIIDG